MQELDRIRIIKERAHILDKESKFMFLASRKCGTQSVCRYLLKNRCVVKKDAPLSHKQKINRYSNKDIENIFKFTIIRNPYERVVSAFHALQQYSSDPRKKGGSSNKVSTDIDFQTFVKTILIKEGLIYDRHFEPQYPNIFYINKKRKIYKKVKLVDFVARLENIQEDWKYISSKIKCDSVLPHENKSKHLHYSTYYDEETKDLIDKLYRIDIKVLGYKF